MYNRYIPNGAAYTRIVEEDSPPFRPPEASPEPARPEPPHIEPDPAPAAGASPAPAAEGPRAAAEAPQEAAEPEKKAGLAGLLKGLKLDDLDTGDILLLLIVLFLFLEGDDIELIITLGLLLVLGL